MGSPLDDAAANLARTTPMSLEQARASMSRLGASPTYQLMDEWKGTLDVPDTETDPYIFMTTNGIDKASFRDALIEYRNLDTGYVASPWAMDEIGVLSADFINWYRWERL